MLYDATLEGNFNWALTKPQDSDLTTYTLNLADADYTERSSTDNISTAMPTSTIATAEYTVFNNTSVSVDDIDLYPAKTGKTFIGWSTTNGGSVISTYNTESGATTNKITAPLNTTTLYAVYEDATPQNGGYTFYQWNASTTSYKMYNGSYDDSGLYIWTGTKIVVPDLYNDGTNGVAKVEYLYDNGNGYYNPNTSVTKITVGRYIKEIGQGSLNNWQGVTEINYFAKNVTTVGSNVLEDAGDSGSGISLKIGKGVEGWTGYLFGSSSFMIKNNIASVVFESGSICTSIPDNAFSGCEKLTSVVLPEHCTSIGDSAFYYCKITSINLPVGLKSIGSASFSTTRLASVSLPEGLESIGGNAFASTWLTTIVIPEGITELAGSFTLCTKLTSVTLPSSLERLGSEAFSYCTSLTTVTVPYNVKYMDRAFEGCTKLLVANGGSGIVFENPYGWTKSLGSTTSSINFDNSAQNAIELVNSIGAYTKD